jgi:enterochelin esterase-like enzyme
MRSIALGVLIITSTLASTFAAADERSLIVGSEILGKEVLYSVYLPSGYESSTRSYPVVYALHGAGGYENYFFDNGFQSILDRLIESKQIPPLIVIMPDGQRSRYINNYDNTVRYEDFFFDELIPEVESKFRVISSKQSRAVAGTSMGGYGSMVYAMRRPDMFAASVSVGASFCEGERIENMSNDEWNDSTRGAVYGFNLDVPDRLTDHYKAHDPCFIIEDNNSLDLTSVGLYLDCGDDDFRNDGNARLHILMRNNSIEHEYRVGDGAHDWEYFGPRMEQGLIYIASRFGD